MLTSLALSLPLLASPAPDTITLKPEQGLVLRKTFRREFENEAEMSMEDSTTTVSNAGRSVLIVVDTILGADGDRVTKLERTYEEAGEERSYAFEGEWGADSGEDTADCELEDETVTFEWDEDEEAYEVSGDQDDDRLTDLRFDLDLVGFLPDGEVDEGDEWELEAEAFQEVVAFMDGVPLEWPSDDEGEAMEESEGPETDERTDGEITLTYAGTRTIEGVELAVIELEGEVETERTVDSTQTFDEGSATIHREEFETREVEGVLLWDIEHGHAHSLEIEVEVEGESTDESTFEFDGQEFNHSSDQEMTGTVTFEATFERVED